MSHRPTSPAIAIALLMAVTAAVSGDEVTTGRRFADGTMPVRRRTAATTRPILSANRHTPTIRLRTVPMNRHAPVVRVRTVPMRAAGYRGHRSRRTSSSRWSLVYSGGHLRLSMSGGYGVRHQRRRRGVGIVTMLRDGRLHYLNYPVGGYGCGVYYVPAKERSRTRTVVVDTASLYKPAPAYQPVVIAAEEAPPVDKFASRLSPRLGGPDEVGAVFALGEERLRAGNFKGAVTALRRAEAAGPGQAAPKVALALAYTGARQYWGAARMLRRGVRLLGSWKEAKVKPTDAFGDWETYRAVQAALREDLRERPYEADVLLLAAYLHFLAGEYAEAALYLERADRDGMAEEMTKRLLAEVLTELGDEQQ